MNSSSQIFNIDRKINFLARASCKFSDHDFLYQWVAKDIVERLSVIKRDFKNVLLAGPYTQSLLGAMFPDAEVMQSITPENLNDKSQRFDCIISMGEMHIANDLPGLLVQMRRALRLDGVVISAFAGGETLHELRESLLNAEIEVMGGASPRVYPFIDKQQMASLMQRAGYALPVVDSEILTISYRDMFHVMSDIRGMGESNGLTDCYKPMTPSKLFFKAAQYYQDKFKESDGRVTASYEILFVIGWAPHDSQQKPAKRGSGQVSLSEILS